MMREKIIFIILGSSFVLVTAWYLFQGSIMISMGDLFREGDTLEKTVFWNLRLPRYLLAVLAGSSLATTGAMIQGIFRNPLVEPGLIGISSGGALFASIAIVYFDSWIGKLFFLQGFSFFGSFLVSLLVYSLSSKNGKVSVLTLLLVGIGVNAACGSFLGLLHYLASDNQIRAIAFWSLGSLAGANWEGVISIMPFALVPVLSIPFLAKSLNAFLLGEREAGHLGYSVEKTKLYVLAIVCLSVASVVSITGIIGFVGLVVPHIVRIYGRANHKFLLPASAWLGANLMIVSDGIARVIVSPSELPIGILTAGVGAPIFLWILYQKVKEEA